MTVGCDRSVSLCNLASIKHRPSTFLNQNQLLVCDNLALPFRSDLFDAVISIGVVHHFSTEKRRAQAISELSRILKPGGKIMIYVWAMEQRSRKFNSQDVLVPMIQNNQSAKSSKESKLYRGKNNQHNLDSKSLLNIVNLI
jgi:ubiquinone/menaquinone biosynthesis C-methylase UbiE